MTEQFHEFDVCLVSQVQQQSEPCELPTAVMNVSVSVVIVCSRIRYRVVVWSTTVTDSDPFWLQSLSCSEIV